MRCAGLAPATSRWRRSATSSKTNAGASRRCVACLASAPRTTSIDEGAAVTGSMMAHFTDMAEARRVLLGRRAIGEAPLPAAVSDKICQVFGEALTPAQVVERIIADVRVDGDDAVRRYTRLIDGRELDELRVSDEAIEAGIAKVPADVYFGLEAAAERIRLFHERARRNTWMQMDGDGATGQIIRALDRVGVYAPGGRAPYPSTALMAAVPARVAGVREVVLASP